MINKRIVLGALALVLAGCSGSQDVGDADKPMPKGATATAPNAPAGAGGGPAKSGPAKSPAAPTSQGAQS